MSGKPRILVVEDGVLAAEDLRAMIEKLGFEALPAASSAAEALERAARSLPDLVLMDIRLEGQEDGISAAGRLRKQMQIPVIYITAHADPQTLARAVETSPLGYLTKPFTERSVAAAILTALQQQSDWHRARGQIRMAFAVMDQVPEGVVAVDGDGKILFHNRAALSFLAEPESDAALSCIHSRIRTSPAISEVLDSIRNGSREAFCEYSRPGSPGVKAGRLLAIPILDSRNRMHGVVLQTIRPAQKDLTSPIATLCSRCKKVRRSDGLWEPIEDFLARSFHYFFSHGLCTDCFDHFYDESAPSGVF